METEKLLSNCDVVSLAGAAKNIASLKNETDRSFVLNQINLSKQLHDIQEIILMNHTDCGAYGGKNAFASEVEEHNRHKDELNLAKKMIAREHPDLTINTVLAKIDSAGEVTIQAI